MKRPNQMPWWGWALEWLALFGLWIVFVWSFDPAELAFGAVAAALSLWALHTVWSTRLIGFYAHWRLLGQVRYLGRLLFTGTWEILVVFTRELFGGKPAESLTFAVPFDVGGNDDASQTRRALAIALTTAAPNFIVIGIDHQSGLLLFHQIQKSDVPKMLIHLGARV